jgi:hypothetical protein
VNIVPGALKDQSAYLSEVAGIFGIATMIREICAFHEITAGTVYLGCDGLSALVNCTDIMSRSSSLHKVLFHGNGKESYPQFGSITATRAIFQQCPVKWVPHHVLGHQDDDPDAFLDRWATLNIETDDQAKVHWADTVDQPRDLQFTISGEPWAIRTKQIRHFRLVGKVCNRSFSKKVRFVAGAPFWGEARQIS